jgi:hypothetical protein
MLSLIPKALDAISSLLLLVFALRGNRSGMGRDYMIWFIAAQALLNSTAYVMDQILMKNNLPLYHLNCLVSFLILSAYFSTILHFSRGRFMLSVATALYLVFFFINLMLWESIWSFNSNSFSIASFILITYCFLFYLEKLIHPATTNIAESRDFWYVTGIFTYYAGSFAILGTYRVFTQLNVQNLGVLWQAHNIIFLILCLYLFKAILCKPSQEKFSL